MNKMGKKVLSIILCLCLMIPLTAVCVSADGETSGSCGGNVTWEFKNGTLTISGNGEMRDYFTGKPAPWHSLNIETVIIKDGITKIGQRAFYDLEALTKVEIPDSVEVIESAFSNCISLTSITIPEGVTTIRWYTFLGCESLKEVNLPSTLTNIEMNAFFGCKSLTSITIPEGVVDIPYGAFNTCWELALITFKGTSVEFGEDIFSNARNVKIYVPKDSVETYKTALAGQYLDRDKTILVSDLVREIGAVETNTNSDDDEMSGSCGENATWKVKDGVLVISGSGEIKFDEKPWNELERTIDTVVIEEGITSIGDYAFKGYFDLKNISLPSTLKTIGKEAFGSTRITKITIPENVYVGDIAFKTCLNLTDITFSKGVTFGKNVLSDCFNIENFTFLDETPRYEKGMLDMVVINVKNFSVPAGSEDAYADSFSSENFANIAFGKIGKSKSSAPIVPIVISVVIIAIFAIGAVLVLKKKK